MSRGNEGKKSDPSVPKVWKTGSLGYRTPSLPRDRQTDTQERRGTEKTVRDGLG